MPLLLFLTSVPSCTSQSSVLRRSSVAFKGLDAAPFGAHQCCSQNRQVVLPSQSNIYLQCLCRCLAVAGLEMGAQA